MKLVYQASDILEGHIVCNMLRSRGLSAELNGEYQQGAVGELMPFGFARISVPSNEIDAAKKIIEEYENALPEPSES